MRYLRFVLMSYLVLAVIVGSGWLALRQAYGLSLYSVQTGSMAPVLRPGDLALSVKPRAGQLDIGEIITYKNAAGTSITHRIYSIDEASGTMITKGDNLSYPDPPISSSQIQSKTIKAVPGAGHMLDFLHRPLGLILLVYLPALLISALQLQKLIGWQTGRYSLQTS